MWKRGIDGGLGGGGELEGKDEKERWEGREERANRRGWRKL